MVSAPGENELTICGNELAALYVGNGGISTAVVIPSPLLHAAARTAGADRAADKQENKPDDIPDADMARVQVVFAGDVVAGQNDQTTALTGEEEIKISTPRLSFLTTGRGLVKSD